MRQRRKFEINIPLFLLQAGVDADTREVARDQKLVQFDRSCDGLDEDDNLQAPQHRLFCNELKTANLVEFEGIEKLIELPVFADLIKLDVVLLETVESQLRLIIDEDLERLQDVIGTKR